jgi:hypothetical protein
MGGQSSYGGSLTAQSPFNSQQTSLSRETSGLSIQDLAGGQPTANAAQKGSYSK